MYDFQRFANPCTVDIHTVRPQLQIEVANLQTNTILKSQLQNKAGLDVFRKLDLATFPSLRAFAARISAMFGSTYMCEQFFSKLKIVKSKSRSRLTDENLRALLNVNTCEFTLDVCETVTLQLK